MLEADGIEALELPEDTSGNVGDHAVAPDDEAQLSDVHLGVEVGPYRIAKFELVKDQTVGVLCTGQLVIVAVTIERSVLLLDVANVYLLLFLLALLLLAVAVLHR